MALLPLNLRPLACTHDWVARVAEPGARYVDATAGNGHDTVFLAGLAGEGGRVDAFDVQPAAIATARRAVEAAGYAGRVEFHTCSHARMAEVVPGELRAVMFNLGYLPGGDKGITTTAAETLPALETAFHLLAPGGLLTVMCYPGHDGGREECAAVCDAWAGLPLRKGLVCRMQSFNGAPDAPFLLAIQKHPSSHSPSFL